MMQLKTKTDIPINIYRPKKPLTGRCLVNQKLVQKKAVGDVRHLIFELPEGDFRYLEGQSIGIIPPGMDGRGKPHKLRLYSIASTRHGDHGDDRTVSLCVRLLEYAHPETGETVNGVCSSHLCNLSPGDQVQITGPVGTSFFPPDDPHATLIMIATGTGIAPFRAFLRRMFNESHADYSFNGFAWLLFGIPTTANILYKEELESCQNLAEGKFRLDYAISREQMNMKGGKMYIQDRIAPNAADLWSLIQKENTYGDICGLKGMEGGIDHALHRVAQQQGVDWAEYQKHLRKAGRWHVETY